MQERRISLLELEQTEQLKGESKTNIKKKKKIKEIKKGVHARKKDLKDMKIACILNKIKDPA